MSWFKPWKWGSRKKQLREAYLSPYGGVDETGPHADRFFRSLGADGYRDISPYTRQRILTESWFLYSGYPLARRSVDILVDYAVGEGTTYRAQSPKVDAVLEAHWNDPVNDWPAKQHQRALSLFLFGELIMPVFVEEYTGRVRLGSIDPLAVAAVVLDPENAEIAQWVVLTADNIGDPAGLQSVDYAAQLADPSFDPESAPNWLRVIHQDEGPNSPTKGLLVGDVHYFGVNRVAGVSRGVSSLLPVLDWLGIHERFLMDAAEAAELKSAVCFDVTVAGADDAKIEEMRKKQPDYKYGQTRYHNDAVDVQAIKPELGSMEIETHANMVKRHIAAGMGIPSHWLSEGSEASKATALAMGEPTTKSLRAKQREFREVVSKVLAHQIDQAIIAGTLDADEDKQYRVITPPIWPTDVQQIGASMLSTAQALMLAEQNGWKSAAECARVFDYVTDQLGLETSAFSDDTAEPVSDAGGLDREGGRMPGLEDMTAMQMRRLKDEALGMARSMREPVAAENGRSSSGQS